MLRILSSCVFFNFSPKIFKKLGKGSRRLKVFLLLRFHIKLVGLKIHKKLGIGSLHRRPFLFFFLFHHGLIFSTFSVFFFTKIVRWNQNLSLGTKLINFNLNFGRKLILKKVDAKYEKVVNLKKKIFLL